MHSLKVKNKLINKQDFITMLISNMNLMKIVDYMLCDQYKHKYGIFLFDIKI